MVGAPGGVEWNEVSAWLGRDVRDSLHFLEPGYESGSVNYGLMNPCSPTTF